MHKNAYTVLCMSYVPCREYGSHRDTPLLLEIEKYAQASSPEMTHANYQHIIYGSMCVFLLCITVCATV